MASNGPSRHSRRFTYLTIAIVATGILYSAGWYVLSRELLTRAEDRIELWSNKGARADCDNMNVRGYPFRLGIFCDAVRFEHGKDGLSVKTGPLRSAAQIYQPSHIVSELDGPAEINIPRMDPLNLSWQNLRSSTRISGINPQSLSIEADMLRMDREQSGENKALAEAHRGEIHTRRSGEDLEVALRFKALAIAPDILPGAQAWPLDGEAAFHLDGNASLLGRGVPQLRGLTGQITTLTLTTGSLDDGQRTGLLLKGPFAIDADGLVDANLTMTVENIEQLAEILSEFVPQARKLSPALLLFGGGTNLPLQIRKGRIQFGFLTLGRIPPL